MPPKESESLKFLKVGEAVSQGFHDGCKSIYPLEEVEEDPVWAEKWAKENPYIKAAQEPATFTTEMKIDQDIAEAAKAFTALGEACRQTAKALVNLFLAATNCVVGTLRGIDIPALLKAAEVQKALNEAPPRVRHLARHGKKYRTRKKNINRALREYQRRRKNESKSTKSIPRPYTKG